MIAFWILAPIIVLAALGILFTRKAVHCALLLAVVMISLAMLYAAQDAPFLFAVQIIVYTGAILMLFLFVLMLVGVDASDSLVETIRGQRWIAAITGLLFVLLLTLGVAQVSVGPARGLTTANSGGNIPAIAEVLFTRYVLAFEVTSALLITAALGAMVLAHRERLTPKPTQADWAAQRVRDFAETGAHLGPLPPPGTFARHNAVDTPALLPDGSTAPGSVSRVLVARGTVRTAPAHDIDTIGREIGETAQTVPEAAQMVTEAAGMVTKRAASPAIRAASPTKRAASAGALATSTPEADVYEGSLRPLAGGGQPEGHAIKGNKGSMLFHEPGGRWYDKTAAEVWFDSVESAEAAGFTRAGARKKKES